MAGAHHGHHDPARWEAQIRTHMAGYSRSSPHAQSAGRLKTLVQAQWLDYHDVRDRPEVCCDWLCCGCAVTVTVL